MTEFELIRTYFASQPVQRADVRVGIGDDAAVVEAPAGTETVITTDVMVAGVHFFEDTEPAALGYKALAVNLSDLAAMGAAPAWFLLDLTMPEVDAAWVEAFARGMYELAERHEVQLIGGDTSRGPLAIAITAIGLLPRGGAMRRQGAAVGDVIYVTGTLGDAALAVAARRGELAVPREQDASGLRDRLAYPAPRIDEGVKLRDYASSAIDVSDGLLADLGHILESSGVGARLNLGALPLSPSYRSCLAQVGWDYALAGGDDYELCVTVPPARVGRVDALAAASGFALAAVGEITKGRAIEIYDALGKIYEPKRKSYEHFARA